MDSKDSKDSKGYSYGLCNSDTMITKVVISRTKRNWDIIDVRVYKLCRLHCF
jgi:hypothetical protein